jgi:hypothetical protein
MEVIQNATENMKIQLTQFKGSTAAKSIPLKILNRGDSDVDQLEPALHIVSADNVLKRRTGRVRSSELSELRHSQATPAESFRLRALIMASVFLTMSVAAQTISDNFNDGDDTNPLPGWTHYAPLNQAPLPADNEEVSWTFPADPAGGFWYRIFGGPPKGATVNGQDPGPARVASFRNDGNYGNLFAGVDIVNWDDSVTANIGFIAFRASTPGLLTTSGYLAGYTRGLDDRDQQGTFGFVEFQTELSISAPDEYTGGTTLVSRLDPTKKYRMVVTANASDLRGAIFDRTDLLEAVCKIGTSNSDFSTGIGGIGSVNFDEDKNADYTFDNYLSTGSSTTPVGLPGTPQVLNLVPAAQTLFYTIPATNRINFTIATLNTNQINTNTVKMLLNGVDVTSQLIMTNVIDKDILGNPIGTPNTNFFVRYTGGLTSNTIYNGQITVLDMSGKGTTNNWVFDTFVTNGSLIVEAEDYNFNGGNFMDNPPVSGLKPDGTMVNPGGYFDLVGSPDIDYHDTSTSLNAISANQYRSMDNMGTAQNFYAGDTPRPDHVAAGVPDYGLWQMQAGEWVNHTRTFPTSNWKVYLRTSSQAAQQVRYDQVVSDRSMSNQLVAIRGSFLVPNTGSATRFRYVPLSDAVGNPRVLSLSGTNTLRITPLGGFDSNRQHGKDDNGSLQPTYFLFLPTTDAVSTQPWIALVTPTPGATDADPQPTVQITILNGSTSVNTNSILLRFDGANVTSSSLISGTTTEGPGATVIYRPATGSSYLQPNSTHSVSLVFNDGTTTQSNQWSFTVATVPVIPTSFALASAPDTNFTIQMHKAPNDATATDFPSSQAGAERQLANLVTNANTGMPYVNEAANTPTNYGWYIETNAINYEQAGNSVGFFPGDTTFPGIGPLDPGYNSGDPNFIAMAATIKLQLAAGIYRMGGYSDDGFVISTGPTAAGTNTVLGRLDGCCSPVEFDFIVQTSGVYAFRMLYWEHTGGAFAEWYFVDRTTGVRTLVQPTLIPAIQLFSSSSLKGAFSVEPSAVIDTTAKTVTVAKSGGTRFYRLSSGSALTIKSIVSSGSNIILSYQ